MSKLYKKALEWERALILIIKLHLCKSAALSTSNILEESYSVFSWNGFTAAGRWLALAGIEHQTVLDTQKLLLQREKEKEKRRKKGGKKLRKRKSGSQIPGSATSLCTGSISSENTGELKTNTPKFTCTVRLSPFSVIHAEHLLTLLIKSSSRLRNGLCQTQIHSELVCSTFSTHSHSQYTSHIHSAYQQFRKF